MTEIEKAVILAEEILKNDHSQLFVYNKAKQIARAFKLLVEENKKPSPLRLGYQEVSY